MRISDWSSDVCSSDLVDEGARFRTASLFLASWIFSRRCLLIELPHPARDKCRGHRESRPRGKNIEWLSRRPNVGWASRRALTKSEEHTSELQSLMRISYAVFCLKKKK